MPFIKSKLTQEAAPQASGASQIAALSSPDVDTRWRAARALGGNQEAVAALATALAGERVPRVRQAIITALVRTGDDASVAALLPYLRSQDAGQRSAAIEALQELPEGILPFMTSLLSDSDSDVRLLAAELVRNFPAVHATRLLCGLLEQEQHANVCAAAVDVLAEIGTPEAFPALHACAERFAGTPFLSFAVSIAIARISDAKG